MVSGEWHPIAALYPTNHCDTCRLRPVVSHAVLTQVMSALVDARVLSATELLPPTALTAEICKDGIP